MTRVIAEIGINHNGSVDHAKKLIDIAKEAGCDAVKFQKRTVEVVYTKEELDKPRQSPFGETNGDLKYGLEFSIGEYQDIRSYCYNTNIGFGVSCWDEASVDDMETVNPDFYKVASACLTDKNLLKKLVRTRKPIHLSTGMSTQEQIANAIDILDENLKVIYHCTSTYPTVIFEMNMRCINNLRAGFLYGESIGFSSHSDSHIPAIIASAIGAEYVEVHITDNKNQFGSDQKSSLEPDDLKELCYYCNNMYNIKGTGIKKVYDSELPIIDKLRRVK